MLTLLSLDVSLTSDRLSLMMGVRPLGSQLSFSAPLDSLLSSLVGYILFRGSFGHFPRNLFLRF